MVYTNLKESEFFKKSKYEFLKHEFDFEALAKLTCEELAQAIKKEVEIYNSYIKKFTCVERENCYFLYFLAWDGTCEDYITVIQVYFDKKDFFDIDVINSRVFEALNIKVTHKD